MLVNDVVLLDDCEEFLLELVWLVLLYDCVMFLLVILGFDLVLEGVIEIVVEGGCFFGLDYFSKKYMLVFGVGYVLYLDNLDISVYGNR